MYLSEILEFLYPKILVAFKKLYIFKESSLVKFRIHRILDTEIIENKYLNV